MKLSTVVCQCHHGHCHHPGAGENASPQLLDLDPQLSRIHVRVAEALVQAVGVIWVGGHLLGLAQVQWLRLSEVVIDVKSQERVLCPPGWKAGWRWPPSAQSSDQETSLAKKLASPSPAPSPVSCFRVCCSTCHMAPCPPHLSCSPAEPSPQAQAARTRLCLRGVGRGPGECSVSDLSTELFHVGQSRP